MVIDDYDSVFNLWRNTPGMGLYTTDDSRESIERYLLRNPNTCFAAEVDAEIVGAILSGHDGRRGFIYHAAVAVNQRNSGIGGALVDAAMGALKNEGINKVGLTAYSNNEIGNRFWEKQGFTARTDLTYRDKEINKLERIK